MKTEFSILYPFNSAYGELEDGAALVMDDLLFVNVQFLWKEDNRDGHISHSHSFPFRTVPCHRGPQPIGP